MREGLDTNCTRHCGIINKGDLVYIGSVNDLGRNKQRTGIIIEYSYGFGYDSEEWFVLIDGKIERVTGMYIWLVENCI